MAPKATDSPPVQISVVIPAFNESQNIPIVYQHLNDVLKDSEDKWEIIFVDDGSSDDTWNKIEELHSIDQRVCGLRLSRNFGHQYALFAGLNATHGKAIISMDADLQPPPF